MKRIDNLIGLILFLALALSFAIQGTITILYILLIGTCIIKSPTFLQKLKDLKREEKLLLLSFTLLLIATLISAIYTGEWNASAFENPIRLAMAAAIYPYLKSVDRKQLAFGFKGLAAAALLLFISHKTTPPIGRWENYLDAVYFGAAGVVALSASITLILIDTSKSYLKFIYIFSAIVAAVDVFKSGTRGAWLAALFGILPYLFIKKHPAQRKLFYSTLIIAILGTSAVLPQSKFFDHRITEIKSNIISWEQGDPNTSLGIRLTIWSIAVSMYHENLLFGKGPGTFTQTVDEYYKSGLISQEVMAIGGVQPHNEYLAAASQLGTFGLIADIGTFLIPLGLFIKFLRTNPPNRWAVFGVSITLIFMLLGIGIEILLRVTFSSLYGLIIALTYILSTYRTDSRPEKIFHI